MTATLTFGKHKGQPLDRVPRSYLEWLQGQGIRKADLRRAVEDELQRRDASDDPFRESDDRDQGDSATTTPAGEGDPVRDALVKLEQAVLLLRAAIGKREARPASDALDRARRPPAAPRTPPMPPPTEDFQVSDDDVPF